MKTCSLICADGYYLNNNYCLACDVSCMTCGIKSTICTKCDSSGFYPYYNQILNTCSKICADGFFQDVNFCIPCSVICSTCTITELNCKSCNLTSPYPYLNPSLNTCNYYCGDGYFLNMNYCLPCDVSCSTC